MVRGIGFVYSRSDVTVGIGELRRFFNGILETTSALHQAN
jgi:hypothetical protein